MQSDGWLACEGDPVESGVITPFSVTVDGVDLNFWTFVAFDCSLSKGLISIWPTGIRIERIMNDAPSGGVWFPIRPWHLAEHPAQGWKKVAIQRFRELNLGQMLLAANIETSLECELL